jgi:hypothetical protein
MNDASRERRWIRDERRDVRCRNPGSREATKTVASALRIQDPQGEKMGELGSQMSENVTYVSGRSINKLS